MAADTPAASEGSAWAAKLASWAAGWSPAPAAASNSLFSPSKTGLVSGVSGTAAASASAGARSQVAPDADRGPTGAESLGDRCLWSGGGLGRWGRSGLGGQEDGDLQKTVWLSRLILTP